MKLADELFNHPEKVDLIIGAELFYELLQSGRLRLPGNYPMLQETVLGWIAAGRTPVGTQCDPLEHFCYEFPRGEEDMLRLQHHPGCKDTSSTARTLSAVGRCAKHSNGTKQHNWWDPHGQCLSLFCSDNYRNEGTMVVSAIHCWEFLYFVFFICNECTCTADLLSSFRRVAFVRTDASANFASF